MGYSKEYTNPPFFKWAVIFMLIAILSAVIINKC
jgi:hypothetical protein